MGYVKQWRFVVVLSAFGLATLLAALGMVDAGGPAARAAGSIRAARPVVFLATPIARATAALDMAHADDARLFIVERGGRIKILEGGAFRPTPFLDLSALITLGDEQGLLGMTFHPNYASNGYFYVYYSDLNGDARIMRYTRSAGDPNVADPNSAFQILFVPAYYDIHYGGQLAFGADGYLYIAKGDGGPSGLGQHPNVLSGKILRVDVDGAVAPTPYVIPTTNPFYGQANTRWETWAWGMRNPWRFSFDRATGDLYFGDVGEWNWEEINVVPAGEPGGNYGWDLWEGRHCFNPPTNCTPTPGATPFPRYVTPVVEYDHATQGCAVVGGYVYRGTQVPRLNGVYFFSDFCSGRIWALQKLGPDEWQLDLALDTAYVVSAFGQDRNGELYLLSNGGIQPLVAAASEVYLPAIAYESAGR